MFFSLEQRLATNFGAAKKDCPGRKEMSIYFKFIFLCVFLVVFTTSSIFYYSSLEAGKMLKSEVYSELSQHAKQSISSIDRFIHQRLSDMRTLAKNPALRSQYLDSSQLNQHLRELQSLNELYYSFSFFNLDRVRLGDSKGLSIGKTHSYSRYWTQLSPQSDVIMDISRSESVGEVTLHFAAIIKNYQNQPIGLLVSRVLIDRLYEVFDDLPSGQKSGRNIQVDLIDKEGLLLYSNHSPKGVLKDKFANMNVLSRLRQNQANYLETDSLLYFYAHEPGYMSFKGHHWALITNIPKQIAFEPLNDIFLKLLFYIVLPVLGISLLLAIVAANVFVDPILHLSKAADEIAKGNWDININIKSKDELGKFARQLSETAQILIKKAEEQKKLNFRLNKLNLDMRYKYNKIQEQKEEIELQKEQIEAQNQVLVNLYQEIKLQNHNITASINYAERIQKSTLPDKEILNEVFSGSFIFYKPRDIVSGDFYWFRKKVIGQKEYFVIAAADCTGHGVPGAILAMLGSNLLTNLIYHSDYIEPSKILNRLNSDIKTELNQEINSENNQDGMEIALCVFDLEDKKLYYSGGGRPLYHFRNNKLEIYKGNKVMIGGVVVQNMREVEKNLVTHSISLEKGDSIYLFSDGYQDQFGGHEDRKFLPQRFRNLLHKIQDKDMSSQQSCLEETFLSWKKDKFQTDDVMVIGLKV